MLALLVGLIAAATHLEGSIPEDGTDYVLIDFDVPEGTMELEIAHTDFDENVLDWGVWSPTGFRGWSNQSEEPVVIGLLDSSRGYLPGPITPGPWTLLIGKARVTRHPARWSADVTLRSGGTLAPRPRAPFAPVQLSSERRWYKGDFHVHSAESGDGTARIEQIVELARAKRLDFVVITDHNTVSHHELIAAIQRDTPDVLLIRGAEITTYAGHGNALGISAYVDHRVGLRGRTVGNILDEVSAQGGLFMINHPAAEIDRCIGCAWRHLDTPWGSVSAIEIASGRYELSATVLTPKALAIWDGRLARGYKVTGLGGSDDHHAGDGFNEIQGVLGSPTTLVFAEGLSEAAILDGVRKGRAVVQLHAPDDPFVELTAVNEDGEAAMIGDTLIGDDVELKVSVAGGAGMEVRLLRNGLQTASTTVTSDDWDGSWRIRPRRGDRFRAQLAMQGDVVITNHLFLEPRTIACVCASLTARSAPAAIALLMLMALRARRRTR